MRVKYKDFIPHTTRPEGFFTSANYEPIGAVVAAANKWIEKNEIDVINVETVLLPVGEDSSDVTFFKHKAETAHYWYQFIRVWYRK